MVGLCIALLTFVRSHGFNISYRAFSHHYRRHQLPFSTHHRYRYRCLWCSVNASPSTYLQSTLVFVPTRTGKHLLVLHLLLRDIVSLYDDVVLRDIVLFHDTICTYPCCFLLYILFRQAEFVLMAVFYVIRCCIHATHPWHNSAL